MTNAVRLSFAYCDSFEWEQQNGEKQQNEEDTSTACAIYYHFLLLSLLLLLSFSLALSALFRNSFVAFFFVSFCSLVHFRYAPIVKFILLRSFSISLSLSFPLLLLPDITHFLQQDSNFSHSLFLSILGKRRTISILSFHFLTFSHNCFQFSCYSYNFSFLLSLYFSLFLLMFRISFIPTYLLSLV